MAACACDLASVLASEAPKPSHISTAVYAGVAAAASWLAGRGLRGHGHRGPCRRRSVRQRVRLAASVHEADPCIRCCGPLIIARATDRATCHRVQAEARNVFWASFNSEAQSCFAPGQTCRIRILYRSPTACCCSVLLPCRRRFVECVCVCACVRVRLQCPRVCVCVCL